MLVEISTDNRNRTASEIRSLVTKNGGTIATQGSVTRLFHRKGQIIIAREAANEDQLMELALEAGAEDFKADPKDTRSSRIRRISRLFISRSRQGHQAGSGGCNRVADRDGALANDQAMAAVTRLIEALEDHDDVKEVYTNAESPDDAAKAGA